MIAGTRYRILLGGLYPLTLFLFSGTAVASDCNSGNAVAIVESIQGEVGINQVPALMESLICRGDVIRVSSFSRAAVRLTTSDTVVRLNQNTQLQIPAAPAERHSVLNLIQGVIYLFSREPRAIDVNTVYANAAVEGTEFTVQITDEQTIVTVLEGRVRTHNDLGEVNIKTNQAAVAEAGRAPQLLEIIKPENAVQWALYYQPILNSLFDPISKQEGPTLHQINTNTDIAHSLARLEEIPQEARNEDFYVFRAALYLAAGQVNPAMTDIERAFQTNPNSSGALSLQSIIAVTNNEPKRATQLAEGALTANPESSAALLALSYARQSDFDIDGALASARAATEYEPGNALAWARVAELWLSLGDFNQALLAAQRAVELNPDLARTQTVLGFANLIATNFDIAVSQFDRAVELDQTAPLPRLGRGLVLIRQGKLKLGREELEIAVGLDPGHALLRSYLGKAYFEERRPNLASEQYALAKQFDPLDPTAHYYDALLKQADNQPADALEQLRQAIALNDHRAVYRSRLLLDEDRAVRGASLAQIYDNLGFRKLALNEASKSLSVDSSSYSAHRFLSDSYAQFDRREIARSSALLQAQLLQPLNRVPVQPRLAGSNLNITLSEDASRLSYNEYTSMFEHNKTNVTGNAIIGSQNTLSDELILSGNYNRLSYSLGQFHYETDGFRDNNDVEHDIYNTFLQYEINNSMGIQAEYRSRDSTQGDIAYNFELDEFGLFDRRDSNEDTLRIGLRNDISPDMTLISSLLHIQRDVDLFVQSGPFLSRNATATFDGYDGQAQLLFSKYLVDFVAGGRWYEVKDDQTNENNLVEPESGTSVPFGLSSNQRTTRQYNSYLYSSFLPSPRLALQLGASYDRYDDERFNSSDVNVKLAANLELSDNVDLRGAAFTTTKRALVSDQTLEPIQLAGFNQFFDDPNGTQGTVLGLGIDSKFSKNLFVGAEMFQRKLDIPIIGASSKDQNELTTTAYVYRIINSNWSVTMEPTYEKVESDRTSLRQVDTFSIPTTFHYFASNGFYGGLELNFVNHKISDQPVTVENEGNNNEVVTINQDDDFLMTNVNLGYRLPRWHGEFRLEIRNLFNQSFNYQDLNPFKSEPRLDNRYPPERQIFSTLKLLF